MARRLLQLVASADFLLPALGGLEAGVRASEGPRRRLPLVFVDTPDLRLSRWGATLCRWGDEGWSLELPPAEPGASAPRVLALGPGEQPPARALLLVGALARRAALEPLVEAEAVRSRIELRDDRNRLLARVVDDAIAPPPGHPGSRGARLLCLLPEDDLTEALADALESRLRAAGARDREHAPLVEVLGSPAQMQPEIVTPELEREPTASGVIRRALALGVIRLIRHDPGVRLGDDPEDVHQARVATRRLRSNLATFAPLLDEVWVKSLRRELRWLGRALGRVRDADVLVERLRGRVGELGPDEAAAAKPLLEALETRRSEVREGLLASLDGERYLDLLDNLVAGARAPHLGDAARWPARVALPPLLVEPWKRLAASVQELGETPRDEELHALRIDAKRCRYAAEAVAPACGKAYRRFARSVAKLQEVLGEHQDAVVAHAWLRGRGDEAPEHAFAAGLLAGLEHAIAQRSRAAWREIWDEVEGRAAGLALDEASRDAG